MLFNSWLLGILQTNLRFAPGLTVGNKEGHSLTGQKAGRQESRDDGVTCLAGSVYVCVIETLRRTQRIASVTSGVTKMNSHLSYHCADNVRLRHSGLIV